MTGNQLEGKVAAVTGGASGIGLASVEAMIAAGAKAVVVDRDQAALDRLVGRYKDDVIPLVLDLLDPADCATLLPRILERTGKLDISTAMPDRTLVAIWSKRTIRR